MMLFTTFAKTKLGKATLVSAIAATSFMIPVLASADSYIVKEKDTLYSLAKKNGTTVEELARLNNINNPSLIHVGQVINFGQEEEIVEEETPIPSVEGVEVETVEEEIVDEVQELETSPSEVSEEVPSEVVEETSSNLYKSSLSEEDAAAKEWIAQKESSGSYTAQNGQYYGRYQLTLSYLNGDLSIENQERVADEYVINRYGSWSAALEFWLANGWY